MPASRGFRKTAPKGLSYTFGTTGVAGIDKNSWTQNLDGITQDMSRGDHHCKIFKRGHHWFSCMLCGLMLLAPDWIHGGNTEKPASVLRMSSSLLWKSAHGINHS